MSLRIWAQKAFTIWLTKVLPKSTKSTEQEKPGRSGCDPLVGGENRGGGRSVCPRSFESRADRFADGFSVGSEMKGRDQG